jgi:hypothetical protein
MGTWLLCVRLHLVYHRARATTLAAVAAFSPGRPAIYKYYQSVADWEVVMLNTQIAFDMIQRFIYPNWTPPQEADRLRYVTNRVKHYAEDVANAHSPALVLPLWLTSLGIETSAAKVSYFEIAEMLRALGAVADELQNSGGPSPAS